MKFLMENALYVGLALASATLLIWPILKGKMSNITEMTPAEAVVLMNRQSPLVLDVRDDAEYAAGHITGAKHIPVSVLANRIGEIEAWKDKPVLVHCKAGGRSTQACALLHAQGFSKINNLAGGLTAWQAANLPVVRD